MQSRIVSAKKINPRELVANDKNWRTHPPKQRRLMGDVLGELGFLQHVVVNKTTGRIIDGHMRVELAIEAGAKTVPVAFVELTEAEELKALATFDPIGDLAGIDRDQLNAVLSICETESEELQSFFDKLAEVPERFDFLSDDDDDDDVDSDDDTTDDEMDETIVVTVTLKGDEASLWRALKGEETSDKKAFVALLRKGAP